VSSLMLRVRAMSPSSSSPALPGSLPEPAPVTAAAVYRRGPRRIGLSPSRANDYQQCPLLFRFRALDRLPEPPSPAASRGTLVHSMLERLFDLPAAQRDVARAQALLDPAWQELREKQPQVAAMFSTPEELHSWLASANELIAKYFEVENPRRLEPAEREKFVEVELSSGILLRGFVDRIDVAPTGAMRVVDYKTGRSPRPQYSAEAMFQMRFYALMLWRLTGTPPKRLQLVYLADAKVLTLDPTVDELLATEEQLEGLWRSILRDAQRGEFRPRRSRLCDWCNFQAYCPLFDGTPPELPEAEIARLLDSAAATPSG